MSILIDRTHFEGKVQLAKHCSYDVLEHYILESQTMDLLGLLGNCFYVDVINNFESTEYDHLMNGGEFQVECGGQTKTLIHKGLRCVLVHYAYGAYMYRKSFVDTPFNVVVKQSQDSIPVTTNELEKLKNEHRRIAYSYWKMTLEYLCANKDMFPNFDRSNCADCEYSCDCECESGCGCDKCKGGKSSNNRGVRISIIE